MTSYSSAHGRTCSGIHYYRLEQVDNDERRPYSPVASVNIDDLTFSSIVYPNPASDELWISVPPGKEISIVNIIDHTDNISLASNPESRSPVFKLNTSHLRDEIHFLQISKKNSVEIVKFAVQR